MQADRIDLSAFCLLWVNCITAKFWTLGVVFIVNKC